MAIQLLNTTPYSVGYLRGQVHHPRHSLSFAVKGTFELVAGSAAAVAAEQLPLQADTPEDDEEAPQSLVYPADLVHFKPRADVLLVGTCHSGPSAERRRSVTFGVGAWSKSLSVTGDRYWDDVGATAPLAFGSLPLTYERAFGGPGFLPNTVGSGLVPQQRGDGPALIWLPNIEDPEQPVTSRASRPTPAGFGPLRRGWHPRRSRVGSYGENWRERRWPWYPEDFDYRHHNAAPDDMQLPFLRGDEALLLGGLRPDGDTFRSALPGRRVRCFVAAQDGGALGPLREVAMQLDTLWVDADALRLVLVWRGVLDVESDAADEVGYLHLIEASLSEPEATLAEVQRRCLASLAEQADEEPIVLDEMPATADPEVEQHMAGLEQQTRLQLRAAGLDPDALPVPTPEQRREDAARAAELGLLLEELEAEPEPWTRERVESRAAERGDLSGIDLSGLDLSKLDLSGLDLSGSELRGTRLTGARLEATRFDESSLTGASLESAELSRASFVGADLSGANLSGAHGSEVVFDDALLEDARLIEVRFEKLSAVNVSAPRADWTGASLASACLDAANLAGCILDKANLQGALLRGATVEAARGSALEADAADLGGLLAEDADFPGARLREVRAAGSNWQNANLDGASLTGATLTDANLTSCRLVRADLSGASLQCAKLDQADLRGADLRFANLFEASLESADARDANFSDASLYGAETWKAQLIGARFERAALGRTKLDPRQ